MFKGSLNEKEINNNIRKLYNIQPQKGGGKKKIIDESDSSTSTSADSSDSVISSLYEEVQTQMGGGKIDLSSIRDVSNEIKGKVKLKQSFLVALATNYLRSTDGSVSKAVELFKKEYGHDKFQSPAYQKRIKEVEESLERKRAERERKKERKKARKEKKKKK